MVGIIARLMIDGTGVEFPAAVDDARYDRRISALVQILC
jgi:hypothetical protein